MQINFFPKIALESFESEICNFFVISLQKQLSFLNSHFLTFHLTPLCQDSAILLESKKIIGSLSNPFANGDGKIAALRRKL